MFKKVRIKKNELGLRFERGDFVRLLEPGTHRVGWFRPGAVAVDVVDTLTPRFEHSMLDVLLTDATVRDRLKVVDLAERELAAVWVDGRLDAVVGPGRHAFWKGPRRVSVDVFDTLSTKLEHELLDVLLTDASVRDRVEVVDLADHERALVWVDGRLGWVLGPGRHAFWKAPRRVSVEVFDVGAFRFEHPRVEAVLGFPGAAKFLDGVRVESHERVLVFREGELLDEFGPGMYVFWKAAGRLTWRSVDLREQVADAAGQEIMTADKVTLRVNLVVTYRVVDAVRAVTSVADAAQALYREAQLALRQAVGARTLESLLADKESVGRELAASLRERAQSFGVDLRSVGLRDVILPGEMKQILNQVIEAQKQAEANLIRRREETAAARSQANTAKLLSENPALSRMKELEALQEILKGAKASFVFGGSNLTDEVRRMVGVGGAGPGMPAENG
ncbi:MAG: slipin family protein [Planctomycetota bacterium]